MTRMKAIKGFRHAGVMLSVGDEFNVRGVRDARVLKAIKRAVMVPPPQVAAAVPVAAPRRQYVRRDLAADAPAEPATPAPMLIEDSPRRYARRDLKAED